MGWVENASPRVEAESQWPTIIAICTVMSVLSMVIVCLRLWVRRSNRGLALDDYFAAASMVFALAYSILCIVQTKYGLGLPLKDRPKENLGPYMRVNFAGRPIYQVGISFFKIALLISYLRLLQGTDNRIYRIVVFITIGFVFLNHLGSALTLIFACDPVHKSWEPMTPGKCVPVAASFTAYAVLTIISDVVVAILPVPVLLKLNIRLEKKLGLLGIFALGLFTTLCSIFRYLQIDRIQFGDKNSTMLVLWGVIEFNVGNMVSSLPFLAPVCIKKAKNYRSKHSNNGYGSSGSRNRGLKGGEAYKLTDVSNDKSAFASANHTSGSEENILQNNHSIMKSVTYSVRVEDDPDDRLGTRQDDRV